MSFLEAAETPSGRHDSAARRRSRRSGRERGCWVYIPAADLARAGHGDGPAPAYRTFPGPRGGVVVQLYRDA